MNTGGGDRQSPPLPGGEFLLNLLRNSAHQPPPRHHHSQTLPHDPAVAAVGPTIRTIAPIQSNARDLSHLYQHPPFAPHTYIHGYAQNPNPSSRVQSSSPPLSDSFQKLGINGLSANLSKTHEGNNRQFNRFADNFYGSPPNNIRNPRGNTREGNVQLNAYEANYRNSPNLSSDGHDGNYRNSPNSSWEGSNRAVNGYESNYQNFPNLSRIGEGYDRPNKALNGFESNYRISQNSSRIGEGYDRPNRALNGFKADYRNSPNSSRIGEGNNRAFNGFDSDFPKFPNGTRNQGNISRTVVARQEVTQPPPGFSKKATNRNFGDYSDKEKNYSNGSRDLGNSYEDEREKGVMRENWRNLGDLNGERRISPHLDIHDPPKENALHSVSGFEIEESLSALHKNEKESHRENGENGEKQKNIGGRDTIRGDSDDLDAQIIGFMEEEDESSDKNHRKKRDKDYRSDTRGQKALTQGMRKSRKMIRCRNDIDMFNIPLLAIYDSLVPPEEEKMKQTQLLIFLEKLVVKEWPEAQLHVYGSCANSFGVKNSDIDICLAMKDADVNKCDILLRLADILKAENLENVQALTHARVPIVKLMDPVTGISCDICINNVLAVVNSKLLRDYAKIDGRLRQLAFIVKHWAKSRRVNETYHGTLSSYAYVLMCIHFLQQCRPAILPCLQGMDITYNVVVDNVECAFFDKVEKLADFGLRNRENIGQLVWGFFRYWAYCHDYAHDVVSVRVGSIISKQAKDWTRRVGNDRHLICIEDPFETTHDLGRVVDKFSIKVLREEFERAAEILQFDPNPCVTLFEPYVPSCD